MNWSILLSKMRCLSRCQENILLTLMLALSSYIYPQMDDQCLFCYFYSSRDYHSPVLLAKMWFNREHQPFTKTWMSSVGIDLRYWIVASFHLILIFTFFYMHRKKDMFWDLLNTIWSFLENVCLSVSLSVCLCVLFCGRCILRTNERKLMKLNIQLHLYGT